MKTIYLIGSLRNTNVPNIARELRDMEFDVFDDWYAPGPEADDFWKTYEIGKGNTYKEALDGWAAKHIFEFDKYHLDRADIGVLVLPAGRSCHLELGYMAGSGKTTAILFDADYDRWDVMYGFATLRCFNLQELKEGLDAYR